MEYNMSTVLGEACAIVMASTPTPTTTTTTTSSVSVSTAVTTEGMCEGYEEEVAWLDGCMAGPLWQQVLELTPAQWTHFGQMSQICR